MRLSENLGFREAALQLLLEIPDFRSLSYLELGCGDGWLLDQLHVARVHSARGTTYRPRSQDYIRAHDYPPHLVVDEGINLNNLLPYPDASVNVVYSTEVIEHLEGHRNFVLEAARILKPGGWLVLTTPNLHRLVSRLNFALSGVHANKRGLIPWTCRPAQLEEYHQRCVDFPLLHWLLWVSGIRIRELRTTQVLTLSRVVLVLWPLVKVLTRFNVMRQAQPDAEDQEARRDLLKWMTSRALLCSEQICLKAQKLV